MSLRARLLGLLLAAHAGAALWTFRAAMTDRPNTGDEFAVLFQARIFAGLRVSAPAPPDCPRLAPQYVACRGGSWMGIYPPVYPALLAPAAAWGLEVLAPALLSAACLALVFLLVLRAYADEALAWLTTLLLAASPSFRFHSASFYTHIGSLLFLLIFLLSWLELEERGGESRRAWACLGLSALLGLGSRPYSFALAALPAAARAAALAARSAPARRAARPAAALLAAAVAAALAWNAAQTGSPWRSLYLDTVNAGGRLSLTRHLGWEACRRLWSMLGEAAKWSFACGVFPRGDLKAPGGADLSLSLLVAAAAAAVRELRGPARERRAHLALGGAAVLLVLGHLFYEKEGGRFGERRFFEVHFVFCLLVARLFLAATRVPPLSRGRGALAAALLAPPLAAFPGTALSLRAAAEERLDVELRVEREGSRGALVLVRDSPWLTPRFHLRNRPDLSGTVYALDGGRLPGPEAAFAGRRALVYAYDWRRRDYALIPWGGRRAP